jgi:MFS transporter, DHA1 family, inner membrane transport protein
MTTSGADSTVNHAQLGSADRATARPTPVAVGMYAVLLLSYAVNAMDRQLFPTIAQDVGKQFGFTLAEVGLQSTIFTLGMGLAGIPTGFLLARSSRKFVVLAGLALFSVATLLTAYGLGFWDMLGYRFLSGLGEAMQLTALLAIATSYFVRNRALAVGAVNFTFGVGALVGPNLGAALRNTGGWRHPLISFGIAGFVILVLVALVVRPWLTEARGGGEARAQLEDFGAPRILSRNPMLLGASTVFAGLAIYSYLGLYPTYLREQLHYSAAQAGLAVSMYGLGAFFSLVGGWLGDRVDFRKLLAVALVLSAIAGYVLFSGANDLWVHLVLSFVFGAAISGVVYANLAAGIIKSVKRAIASHGSGLFVATLYVPAAFSGYLFGVLVGPLGWTGAALILICAFCLIAAVLALAARRPAAV